MNISFCLQIYLLVFLLLGTIITWPTYHIYTCCSPTQPCLFLYVCFDCVLLIAAYGLYFWKACNNKHKIFKRQCVPIYVPGREIDNFTQGKCAAAAKVIVISRILSGKVWRIILHYHNVAKILHFPISAENRTGAGRLLRDVTYLNRIKLESSTERIKITTQACVCQPTFHKEFLMNEVLTDKVMSYPHTVLAIKYMQQHTCTEVMPDGGDPDKRKTALVLTDWGPLPLVQVGDERGRCSLSPPSHCCFVIPHQQLHVNKVSAVPGDITDLIWHPYSHPPSLPHCSMYYVTFRLTI